MKTFVIIFAALIFIDIISTVIYYRYHNYIANHNIGKTSNDEVSVLDVSF